MFKHFILRIRIARAMSQAAKFEALALAQNHSSIGDVSRVLASRYRMKAMNLAYMIK